MTLIYSFVFCGIVCLIGQIILDNTTFTPGHITSLFVVLGAVLGIFGLYDAISSVVGAGASLPIVAFGNNLTNAAYQGFLQKGFIGLFDLLTKGSVGIVSATIFSFLFMLLFKPKD